MSSKTVNLIVGPKRKTFVAHKDLLTHLVPYFAEVVSSQLLSSNNDDIYIGSSDPGAAQVFVGWLYRGPSALGVEGKDPVHLVQLYGIAAAWYQSALQNSIIDALITHFRDVLDLKLIKEVAEKCYPAVRPYPKLQPLIMFHTIVAFNTVSWDFPDKNVEALRALVDLDKHFAVDFAVWQVLYPETIHPNKLHYQFGINEQFYV